MSLRVFRANRLGLTSEFPSEQEDRKFAGHWVCFGCRKMFRKSVRDCVCPQCAEPMAEMGAYFEPPKRSNVRMWEMLNALARDGYRFHTEGSRAFFHGPWSGGRIPSIRTVMGRMRKHLGLG